MLRDLPEDDNRRGLVEKIISGVENLNGTVTTLLNYSRTDEVNREEVVLDEFLVRTVEQFRHDNEARLEPFAIHLHSAPVPHAEAGAVSIDPMLMRQMVTNLLFNAVEACGENGQIDITCQRLARQRATHLFGERLLLGLDETMVEVTISDTGAGIAPEHIENIFAPFFTTKKDGNGLGLAVAWKIVKAHGGDIMAENRPEGGARFRVLLPVKLDHSIREHRS